MTTHIMNDGPSFEMPKCGKFDPADDWAVFEDQATCLECRHFDKVQEKWEEYVAQPSNFGEDSAVVRMAEHDAFFAAAFTFIKEFVPF